MSETRGTAPPPPAARSDYRAAEPRNGMGVAALVVGVVSLVLAILVITSPFAFILGIIAIILGAVGMSRASKGVATNRGQALAGLLTGLLSILLAIVVGASLIGLFVENESGLRRFGNCMRQADNDREHGACFRELGDELEDN